ADGVPVVHHDPTLHRDVSPESLAGAALAALNSADLRKVRFKSGDEIPRLVDVLGALTPRTRVYVEIKGGPVPAIANVAGPFTQWIAVHSFDHDAIIEMGRIAPEIARGILFEKA